MNSRHPAPPCCRSTARGRGLPGRAVLAGIALGLAGGAAADERPWTVDSGADLVARLAHRQGEEGSSTQRTLMTSAWVELRSPYRHWSTGLIGNYAYAMNAGDAHGATVGAFLKLRHARASTTLVAGQSGNAAGRGIGIYGLISQFEIDDRRILGIEAFGALRSPRSPSVTAYYERKLARSLSLKAGIGASPADTWKPALQLAIGWSVR